LHFKVNSGLVSLDRGKDISGLDFITNLFEPFLDVTL